MGVGASEGDRDLPPRLAELDYYFEDPRLFEMFRPYFHPSHGRPSMPMGTYVRVTALKCRYPLSYEALRKEVSGWHNSFTYCSSPRSPRTTVTPRRARVILNPSLPCLRAEEGSAGGHLRVTFG